jgi:hypothetical protein
MIINPHPFVLTTAARQRGAELRAEADQCRLAKLAQGDVNRRWPRGELPPVVAVALALLLLLAARSAAAHEPSLQPEPGVEQAADEADTSAVQKVREAAS